MRRWVKFRGAWIELVGENEDPIGPGGMNIPAPADGFRVATDGTIILGRAHYRVVENRPAEARA